VPRPYIKKLKAFTLKDYNPYLLTLLPSYPLTLITKEAPHLTPPQDNPPPEKGRKNFALRIAPELHVALERWAADEMRSVNAQIEYLLFDAVKKAGRAAQKKPSSQPSSQPSVPAAKPESSEP
jgi:hypothetical protein